MIITREFEERNFPGVWMVFENVYNDDGTPVVPKVGPWLFTFDKKKIYNFWPDYPNNLTEEQVQIFKKAFPIMAKLRE